MTNDNAILRAIQWPAPFQNQLQILVKNNVQLAQKPLSIPPAPQIAIPTTGTATGFQFSFNQVQVPTGATNVIAAYRVYRNTQNIFINSSLVHTFVHDPTHKGPITFSDVITAATGANYYYWVTSVDTTGQESLPNSAQSAAVAGSAGSTPFSTTTGFAYTSTTTSITWYWDGTNGSSNITIYRADKTTTGPLSGTQTITGLTSGTTYNFYPYYDDAAKAIAWVAGGSGTPAYAQPSAGSKTLVQQQNLRNHIPLSIGGMQGATTSSGSGSGSGGGGGGGGGCFTGNVKIKTPDGLKRFDSLPGEFHIENLTGVHRAKLLVHYHFTDHMVEFHDGELVTFAHRFKRDSDWIPANNIFPSRCKRHYDWTGTVFNLHVDSEDEEDHHYILENGLVAHNLNKF